MKENRMSLIFDAKPINEGFARACVASFCLQLEPTLEELGDIKTAVSEAVTNAIVHGYKGKPGKVKINCEIKNNKVKIQIIDSGVGIDNIEEARQPFYTSLPDEERSGMGFTVMESFMDDVKVEKNRMGGVTVTLTKEIANSASVYIGGNSKYAISNGNN